MKFPATAIFILINLRIAGFARTEREGKLTAILFLTNLRIAIFLNSFKQYNIMTLAFLRTTRFNKDETGSCPAPLIDRWRGPIATATSIPISQGYGVSSQILSRMILHVDEAGGMIKYLRAVGGAFQNPSSVELYIIRRDKLVRINFEKREGESWATKTEHLEYLINGRDTLELVPPLHVLFDGSEMRYVYIDHRGPVEFSTRIGDFEPIATRIQLPAGITEQQIVAPIHTGEAEGQMVRLGALVISGKSLGVWKTSLGGIERIKEAILMASCISSNLAMSIEASMDPLTGLSRKKAVEKSLPSWANAYNSGKIRHVSTIMMDLDHFKRMNDTHGHLAGDHVLQATGEVIDRQLRNENERGRFPDLRGRWGGEEFVIFLATDIAGTRIVAERIRKALENKQIVHKDERGRTLTLNTTASFGIATLDTPGPVCSEDLLALVRVADRHLYHAKDGGRNRVCGPDTA